MSEAPADTAAGPIVITVMPSRKSDGGNAYSTRGQLFDGAVDGRTIATRSSQPLLDDCRFPLDEGIGPAIPVAMRRAGQDCCAVRSTIGTASGLTVTDKDSPPALSR
jgi:hypothetical protein